MSGNVVDLRRTRDTLAELREMLARDSHLAVRAGAMLRGELKCCDPEEEEVPNDVQMSLRLPEDLVRRLEKLEAKLARDPDFAAFRVSRQAVARLAMQRGLETLEAEQAERKAVR